MRTNRFLVSIGLLACAAAAPAATVSVTAGGMSDGGYYGSTPILSFAPAMVTIAVGDSVTFRNAGGYHNVVADDGSFRCAAGCDGDGSGGNGNPSAADWLATVRFNQAGTFRYHCENHASSGMAGTIVVRAAQGATIGSGLSGAWYNAAQSGHGFLLQVLPGNTMLVVWFVYSPDGSRQNWILAQGNYDGASNSVSLPAYLFENGRFPPNFDPARVTNTPWGTLSFSFSDCDTGQASWNSTVPGYGSGTISITRLASIAGTTCP